MELLSQGCFRYLGSRSLLRNQVRALGPRRARTRAWGLLCGHSPDCTRDGIQMSRPKLLGITHAKARRDQKELDIRFVFDGRSPLEGYGQF